MATSPDNALPPGGVKPNKHIVKCPCKPKSCRDYDEHDKGWLATYYVFNIIILSVILGLTFCFSRHSNSDSSDTANGTIAVQIIVLADLVVSTALIVALVYMKKVLCGVLHLIALVLNLVILTFFSVAAFSGTDLAIAIIMLVNLLVIYMFESHLVYKLVFGKVRAEATTAGEVQGSPNQPLVLDPSVETQYPDTDPHHSAYQAAGRLPTYYSAVIGGQQPRGNQKHFSGHY